MQPTPPNPAPKRSLIWPVAVNLGLLLLAALVWGTDGLLATMLGLVFVNVVTAIVMASSRRIHFVPAFVLSAVVVLLVGFGACMLMLQGIGGGH